MKKPSVLMAVTLAVASVLATGLTVLPGSVQFAQIHVLMKLAEAAALITLLTPKTMTNANVISPDTSNSMRNRGILKMEEISKVHQNLMPMQMVPDSEDNCVDAFNPDQADGDGHGIGNVCDEVGD
jgi:hypothetical protein